MLDNSLQLNGLSESAPAPASSTAVAGSNASRKGGGKVTHDSRGNAVWEWGVATGVFARIKSHELLNMLDNPTLALEGECQLGGEWAGDPYNRR
jgi:hypothetical protein